MRSAKTRESEMITINPRFRDMIPPLTEGQEPQHSHEQVLAWAKELSHRLGEVREWVESEPGAS